MEERIAILAVRKEINSRTVRRETYYTKAAVRFATLKKREETGKVRNCLEPL